VAASECECKSHRLSEGPLEKSEKKELIKIEDVIKTRKRKNFIETGW
jgi:hypothetical protein